MIYVLGLRLRLVTRCAEQRRYVDGGHGGR
uniref:Uncharacterized protein n=1 Tax=Arundo donax TaxID=35708 RepID=A0A0A9AD61_ARUDO